MKIWDSVYVSIRVVGQPMSIKSNILFPDLLSTSDFVRDALKDAVSDFEQCLEGTSRSNESQLLHSFDLLNVASSTPRTPYSNTFPRHYSSQDESVPLPGRLYRPPSNSSMSSISTSSSPDAVLAGLPSSVPAKSGDQFNNLETESIGSINSEMSTATLRNIREQVMIRGVHK